MKTDQGPIQLVVKRGWRNAASVKKILTQAESRVGRPGRTLDLVGYRNGDPHANIAMVEYTEPGERMEYVNALKTLEGVDAAG